jgi:archaellum component FlaG (FlaF/FlaG flagellin family)
MNVLLQQTGCKALLAILLCVPIFIHADSYSEHHPQQLESFAWFDAFDRMMSSIEEEMHAMRRGMHKRMKAASTYFARTSQEAAPLNVQVKSDDATVTLELGFSVLPDSKKISAVSQEGHVLVTIPVERGSVQVVLYPRFVTVQAHQEVAQEEKTDKSVQAMAQAATAMQSMTIPHVVLEDVTIAVDKKQKRVIITLARKKGKKIVVHEM